MIRLHLVDINEYMCEAWETAFSEFPEVEVSCGNITNVAHGCIVSPANSFGFMDGGIDGVYTAYFGDQLQVRLQDQIKRKYKDGLLPVGNALMVPTKDEQIPYMISAPTMEGPMIVPPSNVFFAMNAMLTCAVKNRERITDLFCPGLGTGIGRVSFEDASKEMANAYRKQRSSFIEGACNE